MRSFEASPVLDLDTIAAIRQQLILRWTKPSVPLVLFFAMIVASFVLLVFVVAGTAPPTGFFSIKPILAMFLLAVFATGARSILKVVWHDILLARRLSVAKSRVVLGETVHMSDLSV